jgi:hypothetical protein
MSSAGAPQTQTKKELLAAAKAAAKALRRNEAMQLKLQLQDPQETLQQDVYDLESINYWKRVLDAMKKANDWQSVLDKFKENREQIESACASQSVLQIEDLTRINNVLKRMYNDMVSKQNQAERVLNEAISFQRNSQVPMSEEARILMDQALQPQVHPEQATIDAILEFYNVQKERLENCLQEAVERDKRNVPKDFVKLLDGIFPTPHIIVQNLLLLCTIVKILVGGITFSPPSCDTAINVRGHVHRQLANSRNVDGSTAVLAKHCAEGVNHCLDCAGVQACNVQLLHEIMFPEAIQKMLYSLLKGHDTALEAFLKFCEIQCRLKFDPECITVPEHLIFLRYNSLIEMFIPDFAVRVKRFSEEQRGEIVRLILERLGMTMEQVDSHISAFLTKSI